MEDTVRVGVVGCGAISGAYFVGARTFPGIEITACSDLDRAAALRKAAEFNVPRVLSVDGLLADPEVDVVLNLTVPRAHAWVALSALRAGKHTYGEKPLGVSRDEGLQVIQEAARRGLRVGCAPDTILGSGIQTARKLIDDGAIGRPVAFTAFYMSRGHETWHPSPEFYYERGGGPMFDMGPYYLSALFTLLGPPRRISGAASVAVPHRTITSGPKFGKTIHVETPDHVCGTIEFHNGATGVIVQSFATHHPQYDEPQPITIYGTDGTLRVPDPNSFDGPVHLRRGDEPQWREVEPTFHRGYARSVGLADMASALRTGRPHRCSAEVAYAVLDAMQGFLDAAESGTAHHPAAQFERPGPMPAELPFGVLDA